MQLSEMQLKLLKELADSPEGRLAASDLWRSGDSVRWVYQRCKVLVLEGLASWQGLRTGNWPGEFLEITQQGREALEEFKTPKPPPLPRYCYTISLRQKEKWVKMLARYMRKIATEKSSGEFLHLHPDTPISIIKEAIECCYGPDWESHFQQGDIMLLDAAPYVYLRDVPQQEEG